MGNTVIEISDLSKQYRLGTVSAGTLRGDFQRWYSRLRGKEDPFLKVGQENELSKAEGEYVWALRNIDLKVEEGQVLGIIGKNGAGKSTLLKILSRVTGPSSGSIRIKGRIASLLEVGTGFHPELTGRENIFLNGAILGMKKNEIRSKLDEIVDFAGVAKYLNTPVKRYSSGMYVRLAFAVAAHLESEILVVDEVLAVGDAEFQKKAIGKMQDVSSKQGRTVLFVSHNMESVSKLCSESVLLANGSVSRKGNSVDIIRYYLADNMQAAVSQKNKSSNAVISIEQVKILNEGIISNLDQVQVEIHYEIHEAVQHTRLVLSVINESGTEVLSVTDYYVEENKSAAGKKTALVVLPAKILNKGTYFVRIRADIPRNRVLIPAYEYCSFNVNELQFEQFGDRAIYEPTGIIHTPVSWTISAE